MKLAFDLDGTLYDSFPTGFKIDLDIRRELGYPNVSVEDCKRVFQSKDWRKLYRDLGIREEHLDYVINEFVRRFEKLDPPKLIPGAKRVLQTAERVVGHKNIFIITNAPREEVRTRFERDGLMHYMDRVDNPFEGKSQELFRLATSNGGDALVYIGDLASDGEACREARQMGARNLRFWGIVHGYAYNPRPVMEKFIEENQDFAQILEDLESIERLINR